MYEAVGQYFSDPAGFVKTMWPWGTGALKDEDGPDAWQLKELDEIGRKIRAGEPVLLAVSSGHGVGKSALTAWVIIWFMATRPQPQVVVTANTATQLNTKTWRELAKWHRLKLEQTYENDHVVLAIAGNNAQLYQKFGVDQITDDLLKAELTCRVNVGFGSTNPQQRIERMSMGLNSIGAYVPAAMQRLDEEAIISEVMGALGYKDGARFFKPVDPNAPAIPPQVQEKLQAMEAELQKLRGGVEVANIRANATIQGKQMDLEARLQDSQLERMARAEAEHIKGGYAVQLAQMANQLESVNTQIKAADSETKRGDPTFKSRDNVVVAKIKGRNGRVEERAVVFNESNERAMRMALSLKNLDVAQLEGVMGVSAKITRYFASINTQWNPVFGFVNLTRDVQGAMLNLGTTPLKDHKAEIFGNTFTALVGIYRDARAERRGGIAQSNWAALWEEFGSEGGPTGYRALFATSEDRANKIRHALDPNAWMDSNLGKVFTANGMLRVPLAEAQKRVKWLFDLLSDFNLAMENGVRLSAYKTGIDQGMTRQQAASLAKNLTVNFNRKGQSGQQAGALYAFFNASMQGTARIADTLTTMEPGQIKTLRLSGAGKKIVSGGILLGAMQAVMLAAMGFDDDEPPEFIRERNIIIPIGGKDYITIPMPLGFHFIPNIGRVLTEIAMDDGKDAGKRLIGLFGVAAEAFNPMGGTLSLQTISPTALDPFVALGTNTDWTGKPIYREDFNKLAPTPGFTRNKDTASSWAKWISEAVNYATGGTEYTPGAYSPSADEIDYLLAQLTGGVGRELGKAEQTIRSTVTGEELPTYKIPLLGRYYGSSEGQAPQASKFYTNLKQANEHEAEIKGRRKDGLPVDDYVDDHPGVPKLVRMGNDAERKVSAMRKLKREMVKRDAPREKIKAIDDRITLIMARFNERSEQLNQ